jgi:hypothetical protein
MPACKEVVIIVLSPEAANEISEVPLSRDTISRRVSDVSSDIEVILKQRLISARNSPFRSTSLPILLGTLNLSPTFDTSTEI